MITAAFRSKVKSEQKKNILILKNCDLLTYELGAKNNIYQIHRSYVTKFIRSQIVKTI